MTPHARLLRELVAAKVAEWQGIVDSHYGKTDRECGYHDGLEQCADAMRHILAESSGEGDADHALATEIARLDHYSHRYSITKTYGWNILRDMAKVELERAKGRAEASEPPARAGE